MSVVKFWRAKIDIFLDKFEQKTFKKDLLLQSRISKCYKFSKKFKQEFTNMVFGVKK